MPVYRGRFAPSPTGPLHFGSLVAALASYLEAKTHHGAWLLRIEDLDMQRNQTGAADCILKTLEELGFEWDETVVFQSSRQHLYASTLSELQQRGLIYPCGCSRKEISDSAMQGVEGVIYPGTCRNGLPPNKYARAWRIRVENRDISFEDAIQGHFTQNLTNEIGDFVLKRADGFFAYQLAVVVDDAEQKITHVVRGSDLLASTPRQIYLQRALNLPELHYAHIPVALNHHGEKLSKQTHAAPIDVNRSSECLWQALAFLRQSPPDHLRHASLTDIWHWAKENWQLKHIIETRPSIGQDSSAICPHP
jgi:glutamyl-Q tRNA(Asp) synthetase